jgi:outer membrane protein assembly factor BamA
MKKLFLCFLAFFSFAVNAFDEFLITDIRIVGLQRVSIGSIFTAIPVSVGDKMNEGKVSEITKALFSITIEITSVLKTRDNSPFEPLMVMFSPLTVASTPAGIAIGCLASRDIIIY